MAKEPKHLCKWKRKERLRRLRSYRRIVLEPRFMCQECGRVASDRKYLCEPTRLSGED
jgi:hypothetical protein